MQHILESGSDIVDDAPPSSLVGGPAGYIRGYLEVSETITSLKPLPTSFKHSPLVHLHLKVGSLGHQLRVDKGPGAATARTRLLLQRRQETLAMYRCVPISA